MNLVEQLSTVSAETTSPGFTGAAISHAVLSPATPYPRPLPLLLEDPEIVPPWLAELHRAPKLPTPSPIRCYFIRDLLVVGHDVTFVDGRMCIGTEMIPAYRAAQIQGPHAALIEERLRLPTRVIEEPCFPIAADGVVYGHFLIEALPRLFAVKSVLGSVLPEYRVLVIKALPGWARTIMADVFDIKPDDLIEYDPSAERICLKQAIWPSLAITNDCMHVFNNRMVEWLFARFVTEGGLALQRIFIMRSFFRNPAMCDIGFENEHEVAEIAAREFGFCPLAPETLPWPDQIRLFAGARMIVGRYGSGLHNTLLCRPGARVGVIRFGNLVQSSISALRSQRLAYTVDGGERVPFSANIDHVRRVLEAVVNEGEKEAWN